MEDAYGYAVVGLLLCVFVLGFGLGRLVQAAKEYDNEQRPRTGNGGFG